MEGLPLPAYDLGMLAVLLSAAVFGAWKGMAWQIASLASLVLSAAVAIRFSGPLAPLFSSQEPWNRFVAMLVLYLGVSLAVWLVFRLVSRAIDRVQLREFDRQAGALLGGLKGVALCLVITFFAVTLSEAARQAVLRSRSGHYVARLIQRADPVLPEEVRAVLGQYIDELDRRLDPNTPPQPGPLDRLSDPAGENGRGVVQDLLNGAQRAATSAGPDGQRSDPWSTDFAWPEQGMDGSGN